jgi:hypothetical protein
VLDDAGFFELPVGAISQFFEGLGVPFIAVLQNARYKASALFSNTARAISPAKSFRLPDGFPDWPGFHVHGVILAA